jgi:hypothetical protein
VGPYLSAWWRIPGTTRGRIVAGSGALLLLVGAVFALAEEPKQPLKRSTDKRPNYFLQSAQLDSPLRPFSHLADLHHVHIRAAVVSMPDPIESRLARAFDIEIAALVSAFQTQDYVLDGFAFTWKPRKIDAGTTDDLSVGYTPATRTQPSVVLFRRDAWRQCNNQKGCNDRTDYFVLFIVGETPTVGVSPTMNSTK